MNQFNPKFLLRWEVRNELFIFFAFPLKYHFVSWIFLAFSDLMHAARFHFPFLRAIGRKFSLNFLLLSSEMLSVLMTGFFPQNFYDFKENRLFSFRWVAWRTTDFYLKKHCRRLNPRYHNNGSGRNPWNFLCHLPYHQIDLLYYCSPKLPEKLKWPSSCLSLHTFEVVNESNYSFCRCAAICRICRHGTLREGGDPQD